MNALLNINKHLEEDKESPEPEQEADLAHKLHPGVGIVCCRVVVLQPRGGHHLPHSSGHLGALGQAAYQLYEQHESIHINHLGC